jgi:hypothetical protein
VLRPLILSSPWLLCERPGGGNARPGAGIVLVTRTRKLRPRSARWRQHDSKATPEVRGSE